ncbi:protein PFC0760c isoform X2 [Condylostylus longicornis]|uniref:protein PFC0760c isoform X2 n=1 Tax=Condylostylus longicornis TaxID=2530218 RepID=UPI00244DECBE|nr:protein PFC0760c isoform X2 [Condylostylus longicornis]
MNKKFINAVENAKNSQKIISKNLVSPPSTTISSNNVESTYSNLNTNSNDNLSSLAQSIITSAAPTTTISKTISETTLNTTDTNLSKIIKEVIIPDSILYKEESNSKTFSPHDYNDGIIQYNTKHMKYENNEQKNQIKNDNNTFYEYYDITSSSSLSTMPSFPPPNTLRIESETTETKLYERENDNSCNNLPPSKPRRDIIAMPTITPTAALSKHFQNIQDSKQEMDIQPSSSKTDELLLLNNTKNINKTVKTPSIKHNKEFNTNENSYLKNDEFIENRKSLKNMNTIQTDDFNNNESITDVINTEEDFDATRMTPDIPIMLISEISLIPLLTPIISTATLNTSISSQQFASQNAGDDDDDYNVNNEMEIELPKPPLEILYNLPKDKFSDIEDESITITSSSINKYNTEEYRDANEKAKYKISENNSTNLNDENKISPAIDIIHNKPTHNFKLPSDFLPIYLRESTNLMETVRAVRASSFPKEIKNLSTKTQLQDNEKFLSPDQINNKYNNEDFGQQSQSDFHENFIISDEQISSSLPSTFEKSNKYNSIYNNEVTASNIRTTLSSNGIKESLIYTKIQGPTSITVDQPILPTSMNKTLCNKMNENVICDSKNKIFNINNEIVLKTDDETDKINNIKCIPKYQSNIENNNNQEYAKKDIINDDIIDENSKIYSLNESTSSTLHESIGIKETHDANKSDFSKCPIIVTRKPNKNFKSNENSNIVKLITDSNLKTTTINNTLTNSEILTKESKCLTTSDKNSNNGKIGDNSNNACEINQYQKLPTSLYSVKFQQLSSSPIVCSSNRESEIIEVPTKIKYSSSSKNLNEIITSDRRQINNIPIPNDSKNLISQITLPMLTPSSLSLSYSSPPSSTETSIPIFENIKSKEMLLSTSTQPPNILLQGTRVQRKVVTFNNTNCNTNNDKINSKMLNKVNFIKIEKDDDDKTLCIPTSLSISQENNKINSKVKVMEPSSNMKHSKIMDIDSSIYTTATICSPSSSSIFSSSSATAAAAATTNQQSHENLEFYEHKKLRDENLVQSASSLSTSSSSSSTSTSSYLTSTITNDEIQNQESNMILNTKKQKLLQEIRERNYKSNSITNHENNNKKCQNNTKNYDSTNTISFPKENILTKEYDTSHHYQHHHRNENEDDNDNDKIIISKYSENEFNKNENKSFKTKIVDSTKKDQVDNTIPTRKLFDNNKFDIRNKNYITYTDGEYIYVPKKVPKNYIEMDEHIREISECQNMTDNNEKTSTIEYNNNNNDNNINEISKLSPKKSYVRSKSVPEVIYSQNDDIESKNITNYNSISADTDYKYEIIEKSIAEDLRRIDEFIETSLLKSSLSYDDYYNKYITKSLKTPPIPPPRRHSIKYDTNYSSSDSNINIKNNKISTLPNANTILVLETPLPIIKQMFLTTNSALRSRSISPITLTTSTPTTLALTAKSLDYEDNKNFITSSNISSIYSSSILTTSTTSTTSCNIKSTTTHPISSTNNNFLKNLEEIYDLNIDKNKNNNGKTSTTIIPLQCSILKSKDVEKNIHPTNIMSTESSLLNSSISAISSTSPPLSTCEKFNNTNAFNINNNDIDNLNINKKEKNIMNEKENIDNNGLNEIKDITSNSLVCKDNLIDYKEQQQQQQQQYNIKNTSDLISPLPSFSISLTPTKNIIISLLSSSTSTSSSTSSSIFTTSTNYNNKTGYSVIVNQMENMPVVENVLIDLDNISRELDNSFNNNINNNDNNNSNDDINNQITKNIIIPSNNNKCESIEFHSNLLYKNKMEKETKDIEIFKENPLQSTIYSNYKDMDNKLLGLQYNKHDIKSFNVNNLEYKTDCDKSDSQLQESYYKSQMDNSILGKYILPTVTQTTESSQTTSSTIGIEEINSKNNIEKNLKENQNLLDDNENNFIYDDNEYSLTKSNYGLNKISQMYGKISDPDGTDDYDLYKIVESKNILYDYIITKQNQEDLLKRAEAIIKLDENDSSKDGIETGEIPAISDIENKNREISQPENLNSEKMENHQHQNKIKKPNQQKVVKQQKEKIIQDTTIQKNQHKLNLVESTNSNELTFSDYLTGTTTTVTDSDKNINENVIANSKEITKTSASSLLSSSSKILEETTEMKTKSSTSLSSYNKIMNYTDDSYRGNIQIDDNYSKNNIKTEEITTTNADTKVTSASTISSSNKENLNEKLLNQLTTTKLDFGHEQNNNISMENISSTDAIQIDDKRMENIRYYKMYAEYQPTLIKGNKNNYDNNENKIVCQNQEQEQKQQQQEQKLQYSKQQEHHQNFSEQNDTTFGNISSDSKNNYSEDNYHTLSSYKSEKIDKKNKNIKINIKNENVCIKEKKSTEIDTDDFEIMESSASIQLSTPSTPATPSIMTPFKLPKVLVTPSSLDINENETDIPFPSPTSSIYDNIDYSNQSIKNHDKKKISKRQIGGKSNIISKNTPAPVQTSSTNTTSCEQNKQAKVQCNKEQGDSNDINKIKDEQILTNDEILALEEFERLHHIQQQNLKKLQNEIIFSKINVTTDSDSNESSLNKNEISNQNEQNKLVLDQEQMESKQLISNQKQLQKEEEQIDVRSFETKNNNVNQIDDQKNQQHEYYKQNSIDIANITATTTTATTTVITNGATINSTANVNENYLKTELYPEQYNQQIENISALNINDNEKLKEYNYNKNKNIENLTLNDKNLPPKSNNTQQQNFTIQNNDVIGDIDGNEHKTNMIILNQNMSSNQYTSNISENLIIENLKSEEFKKPHEIKQQTEENYQNKSQGQTKNLQKNEEFQYQDHIQKQQEKRQIHLESSNEIIDICNNNKIITKSQQKQTQKERQLRHEKRWSQETTNQTSDINKKTIEISDNSHNSLLQKVLELKEINNERLDQIAELSKNISTITSSSTEIGTASIEHTPPHTPTIILSTSKKQKYQVDELPPQSKVSDPIQQNNIQNIVSNNTEEKQKDYNLKSAHNANEHTTSDNYNNVNTSEDCSGSRSTSKQYISKKFFKIRSFSQPPPLEYFQSYSPDEVTIVRNFIEAVDEATIRNNSAINTQYDYNIENFKNFLSSNHNQKTDFSSLDQTSNDLQTETKNNHKIENKFEEMNSSITTNTTTTATTITNTSSNSTNTPDDYNDNKFIDNNDITHDVKINSIDSNTQSEKYKEQQLKKSDNNILVKDTENSQKDEINEDFHFENFNDEKTMILENNHEQLHRRYDFYSSDPSLFLKDDDIDEKGQLLIPKQKQYEKDNIEDKQLDDEEGYKRVAWPPTPERKIIREFTPQPQSQGDINQGSPYLNNTPDTNHLPHQPSQNRYLSPQPQSQQQKPSYQSQPQQQQPAYLSQQNPPQQSQQYPGQQYFPKQQQQQHQPPSSNPSAHQSHPQQNSYPTHNPQQEQHQQQPNPMNQSGPTVGFAGGIPVKSIPGLSPNEPAQQQYQQNYNPQSPSQQQAQPIYQAQHQRYQQPEQNSAPSYYQQPNQSYPQQQYQNQVPQQYSQNPPNSYGGWSHVSAPKYNRQPEQQQQQQPVYAPSHQQYNQPQQQQQQYPPNYSSAPVSQFGQSQGGQQGGAGQGGQPQYQQQQQLQNHDQQQPHPGMVTLRKDPPYTQKPAPTVVSQPAAKSLRGGSLMRGDLKWPPQDCRERMAAEAELQRQLELGPANRPIRMAKDYSGFFAKHALSHYYPGYKIPPGTQHIYVEF